MVITMTGMHLPWYFAIPLTLALTVLLGIVIEHCAYKPLREAPRMSIMISAIGVSYLFENLANEFTGLFSLGQAWFMSIGAFAFAVSAFFTGIAGGLYASLLTSVDPKQFYFTFTYTFLLIVVLG